MKEILANENGVIMHVGHEAVILADADGKVLSQRPAGTMPVMTISGRNGVTLKVGTDVEVAVEVASCAVKYAPIKAQIEADALAAKMRGA